MSLIDLSNHFRKHLWLSRKWVGPLSPEDVFYLYKIREAAKEHLITSADQMDTFGYSRDHHREFMAQFYEINDAMFKAHDTEEAQPLSPETARALQHNLRSLRNFFQHHPICDLEKKFVDASSGYRLSLEARPLRPWAAWAKSDEQERRRKNTTFLRDEMERYQDLAIHALKIETKLESYAEQADIGAEIIPLHQDNSPK